MGRSVISIVPTNGRSALLFATTRRESFHGGSAAASMRLTVAANNRAERLVIVRRRFYSRGFTLMEVLVAISIFALIGVASYRVLSSVMQTNERIAAHSEQMRSVNRAFWLLQQDIEQLLKRNVKDISADNPNAENYLLVQNDNELPLQLTRGGRANPLGLPRSSMQRVAYAVGHHPDYEKSDSPHYHEERSYLLRYTWPMLDGSGGKEQAQVQIVLPDIESMTINVLTEQGQQTAWPVEGINDPPLALQLEFTLQDGSSLKRSYKIW